MAKLSTYSALNVAATLDGLRIEGLGDGNDAIVIEQSVDAGSMLVGADGAAMFTQTADRSATITIRVQHTSPTHRQLIQKWKQQRAGRMLAFPFDVIDNTSGEGGTADQCFIMTAATDSKGAEPEAREWVLVTGDWEPAVPNG